MKIRRKALAAAAPAALAAGLVAGPADPAAASSFAWAPGRAGYGSYDSQTNTFSVNDANCRDHRTVYIQYRNGWGQGPWDGVISAFNCDGSLRRHAQLLPRLTRVTWRICTSPPHWHQWCSPNMRDLGTS